VCFYFQKYSKFDLKWPPDERGLRPSALCNHNSGRGAAMGNKKAKKENQRQAFEMEKNQRDF
jgi:hypothetical protein